MGVATAIAVGATVAGAYASNQAAQKGSDAQIAAANATRNAFANIPVPSIEEQKIILQTPSLMGKYTPAQLQAMQLNSSAMEGVKADQGTIDAQNQALQSIGEVAKGGLTQGDLAAEREVQGQVSAQDSARRQSILNAMAQRGTLGSGAELAAQLQGQQQSSQQLGNASNNIIQQAQARALQAMGQQGSLAGQMNSQQFGQRSQIAQAQDAINRFNITNSQNVANQNVGNQNQAQMTNLQAQQALENQRAANANTQEEHNKALAQQQFQNRIQQAGGQARANTTLGNAQANSANGTAGMYAGIAGGIANAATGYGAMQNANEQAEKDRAAKAQ